MAKKPKKSKFFKSLSKLKILNIFAIVIVILLICGTSITAYAAWTMPAWDPQLLTGDRTTFIYDDKDEVVIKLHALENRTEVSKDKMPPNLINAVISIEDKEFYNHHGINFKGIARAFYINITSGDLSQGASTITQQLARNAFLVLDKKWERKIKEILLAFKLEYLYTKDEILTMYLNKIPFGGGAYGVQAAANTYFGKDVMKLSLGEASLIAGLPQSPSAYNPFINLDKAKNRQKMVLNSMVNDNYITQSEADQAYNEKLNFATQSVGSKKFGFYKDAVIDEAIQILKDKNYDDPNETIYKAGLKIYTNMDADLQELAETLFSQDANFPNESKSGLNVQGATVVIDNSNGEIKALMGGRQYLQQRGFNRATNAFRQPGSAIKPITVYLPALEQGIMPYTVINDSPLAIKVGNTIWRPQNYDGSYRGPITMRTAVQWSVNTYAVQLLERVKIETAFDFGKRMGLDLIDSPNQNDFGLAPLALGGLTHGVTPLQLTAAYATVGNGGIFVNPTFINRIVDANNVEIYKHHTDSTRVITEQDAWLMTSMLQTVVTSGTGTRAKVSGVETCGKTGTSEEYANSWFCGYTPQYSCSVWMGYDRQELSMNKVYGGTYPAPIFKSLLTKAHERGGNKSFARPAGIVDITICSRSGNLPGPNCSANSLVTEVARENAVPKETCNSHQVVYICPESGLLAGPNCPNPQAGGAPIGPDGQESREQCNMHTKPNITTIIKNQVAICNDPEHGGNLYRANIPRENQSGGCPSQFVQYVSIPYGVSMPPVCDFPTHQVIVNPNQHADEPDVLE